MDKKLTEILSERLIGYTKEQASAVTDTGNMLISASAGSGKTTVMIERILHYLLNGGEIMRIVAVTFSRASAEEMKEKLVKKLYELIRNGVEVEHLKKQVRLVNLSSICTLDSYFMTIYKRYFEDIGGSSTAEVIDENEDTMLFDDALEKTLDAYIEAKDQVFFEVLSLFVKNRDTQKLKNNLSYLKKFLQAEAEPDKALENLSQSLNIELEETKACDYYKTSIRKRGRRLQELLHKFKERAEIYSYTIEAESCQNFYDVLSDFLSFVTLRNLVEKVSFLTPFLKFTKRRKTKSMPIEEELFLEEHSLLIKEVINFFRTINEKYISYEAMETKEQNARKYQNKILEIAKSAIDTYTAAKNSQNKMNYADIEHFAYMILSNPLRASEVRNSIDYIFVDEYQDTNYLQEGIIAKISREDNVFMVGDSKQAIYQFRYAEPKIFLDRFSLYKNDITKGKNKLLNKNFRSQQSVLDFINEIFAEVMTSDFGDVDYQAEAMLTGGGNYRHLNNLNAAEVVLFPKADRAEKIAFSEELKEGVPKPYSVLNGATTSKVLDVEAIYVAEKIVSMVNKITIEDADTRQERLIKYNDIAILSRNNNIADILYALDWYNVPYSGGNESADAYCKEVSLVTDFLRIIVNRAQDIPLAAVMLSPIGNFGEEELAQIRANHSEGYFWQAVEMYPKELPLGVKIFNFYKTLDNYRILNAYMNAYDLILSVIATFNLENYFWMQKNGEDKVANLRNFVASINGKEYAKDAAMFINYYDLTALNNKVSLKSAGDSVRVMTIHKSKGLEFPIVFLVKTHKNNIKSGGAKRKELTLDRELGMALNHYDTDTMIASYTFVSDAIERKKIDIEKMSELRLMYVAMTRARYHLFISGEECNPSGFFPEDQASIRDWLLFAKKVNPKIGIYFKQGNEITPTDISVNVEDKISLPRYNVARKTYPHVGATLLSAKYSVTQLNNESEIIHQYVKSEPQSVDVGILYHKIIEKYDFKDNANSVAEKIKRIIEEEKIAIGTEINIENLAKTLQNPLFTLTNTREMYREVPFLYREASDNIFHNGEEDKILIQGVVDMIIIDEDNVLLIDFKTSNASAETLKTRYGGQLALYKAALQEYLGSKNIETYLFLVNKNLAVKIN